MVTKSKTASSVKPRAPKRICQNRGCLHMGSYQEYSNFYESRNASIGYHPFCKDCVNDMINLEDMNTVYDVLKILDTPFVEDVWLEATKLNPQNCFDRYLKLINVTYKQWYSKSRWKNSIFSSETTTENEEVISAPEPDSDADIVAWSDDWQGRYSSAELKYLNDYYSDLQNDFKIVTRNHKDYAKKIAQASLAMNQAFNQMKEHPEDKDAVNTYRTASSNFDMLSKSAQFAESQRGANDVSLGCFGRVFDAVEKHNWVPQHVPEDKDLFDKIIDQFSNIKRSL